MAQKTEKNTLEKEIQARIYLDEKMNLPLKTLPKLLLQAFCDGRLKAYYPNHPEVQMSYYDFLAYFGIPEPVTQNDHTCPNAACLQLEPAFTDAFSEIIDFAEMQRLDYATSQYVYDVQYLRFVLPGKYTFSRQEYFGPVFKYAEVVQVFPSAMFFNRRNDAAKFSLKQIFATHNFNAVLFPGKDIFGRYNKDAGKPEKERRTVWEE